MCQKRHANHQVVRKTSDEALISPWEKGTVPVAIAGQYKRKQAAIAAQGSAGKQPGDAERKRVAVAAQASGGKQAATAAQAATAPQDAQGNGSKLPTKREAIISPLQIIAHVQEQTVRDKEFKMTHTQKDHCIQKDTCASKRPQHQKNTAAKNMTLVHKGSPNKGERGRNRARGACARVQ